MLEEKGQSLSIQEIHDTYRPGKAYQQTYYMVQGIISTGLLAKDEKKITYGYDYKWLPKELKYGAFEEWANDLSEPQLAKIKGLGSDADDVRRHLLSWILNK
jgi:hypothetical protein